MKRGRKSNKVKEENIMEEKVIDEEVVLGPVEEITEPTVEEIVVEEVTEDPIEEVVPEPVEEIKINEEPTEVNGFVDGVSKLYVRTNPSKDSDPVGIIDKSTKVKIDTVLSTEDFYKVVTENGLDGYCMKEYITIE